MKVLALALFVTAMACTQIQAQQAQPQTPATHLENVYRQYNGDNARIGIDPGLLLNVSFSSKKISTLRCLIIDGKKTPHAGREFRDLEHAVKDDHFEEWFSIRKGKGRVAAYSLDGPGDLKDLVCLLVGDDDGGLFFHLRGHFTDADKARLEAALQDHECQ
jgi:hypothetical protein